MKALVLGAFGGPLELKDVPVPAVGPNDVLVKVGACGVGLTVVNLLATPGRVDRYPRIPGHEIAGEVVAVGEGVRTIKPGTRVTNHFYMTCGNCKNCRNGRETLCLFPKAISARTATAAMPSTCRYLSATWSRFPMVCPTSMPRWPPMRSPHRSMPA